MTQQTPLKYLFALAFGALCISFAPIFVKMIDATTIGPTAIAFWRTLFGALILFVWTIVKRESLLLPKKVVLFSMIAGLIFCGDLFVWHRSILLSGAGIATILGNTQVFWMALIGVVFFSEKLSPMYVVSVCMAFVGVVLLVGVGTLQEFSSEYVQGIVFGLMTGIFYSGYITFIKKAGHAEQSISFLALMAWTSLFSSLFLGIAMVIENGSNIPKDNYTWMVLFSLAFIAQSLGWYVISSVLPKIKASKSGIILLLQPTLAMVWGVLFFAESLTALQIIGAGLTLAAIYFGSVRKST